jgi:outer membrane protein
MKRIFTSVLLCVALGSNAQSAYTLQGAIDYALANNATYLNSIVDQQLAEMKRKEIRGIGLPQIGGSADMNNFLNIPTSVIPAKAFNPMAPADMFVPVRFGIQFNSSAGITVSQIVFSNDYIVALQASKAYSELSQLNVNRSKIETTVNVSKAYYNVLVSRERAKFLDLQLVRIKKLKDDIELMHQNGVVEKLDVDRVTLVYNNMLSEKEKITKLVELTEYLLKFQMGAAMSESIVLSDSLALGDTNKVNSGNKANYAARSEYNMLEMQLKLNQLNWRRYKMAWMPTLVAFGTHSETAYRTKPNFLAHEEWYPTTLVGLKMSIPIWDGGQTYFRKQAAKLEITKTQNNLKMLEGVIDLEVAASQTSFNNAVLSLQSQQANIKLAEEVYAVSKAKYEQGVGTINEVIDAETSLKESRINYFDALYEYHIAKVEYQKATGSIK